jgi:predicted NBD/HSP70 family sugar kinase
VGYDEALKMAEEGVPAARVAVDNAGRGLGYLIAAVGNLTMPQLVILGGEGVLLAHVAHQAMTSGIAERRHAQAGVINILTTSGDDTEWCRGAAVLALQAHVLGPEHALWT